MVEALALHHYVRCGDSCAHGTTRSKQWHHARPTGLVEGHEACPHFRCYQEVVEAELKLRNDCADLLPALLALEPRSEEGHLGQAERGLIGFVESAAHGDWYNAGHHIKKAIGFNLPESRPLRPPPATQEKADQIRVERANSELQHDSVGRAYKALHSTPLYHFPAAPGSGKAVVEALYPCQADAPSMPPAPGPSQLAAFIANVLPGATAVEVVELITKKSRRTASGPSALNWQTLKSLIKECPAMASALALFVRAFAIGYFRPGSPAHEALTTSLLTLLSKSHNPGPTDAPRPVGVGPALANLARSLVVSSVLKLISPNYALDFGMGTPHGCVKMVHRLASLQAPAYLSFDARNAFGSILREAVLSGLMTDAPWLYPIFMTSYGDPNTVLYYDETGRLQRLACDRGVIQGDPAGPALFQLGLIPTLQALRAEFPGIHILSFTDDVVGAGPTDELLKFAPRYIEAMAAIGLEVNPSKSKLATQEPLTEQQASQAAALQIPTTGEGIKTVGLGVGRPEFLASLASSRFLDLRNRVKSILHGKTVIPHQGLFRLLAFCVAPAATYIMQAIPPHLLEEFAAGVDDLLSETTLEVSSVDSTPASHPRVKARVLLPTKLGGLGVPSALAQLLPTYLGACTATLESRMGDEYATASPHERWEALNADPYFKASWSKLMTSLKPTSDLEPGLPPEADLQALAAAGSSSKLRQTFVEAHHRASAARVLASEPDPAMRAIQRSAEGPESSAFLKLPTGGRRPALDNRSFDLAVTIRVGAPIIKHRSEDGNCLLCGQGCGTSAAHALSCTARGVAAGRTKRHSIVQNEVVVGLREHLTSGPTVGLSVPDYDDYFPRHTAAPQDKAPGNISHADFSVTHQDVTYLVDLSIAGVNQSNLHRAQQTRGAMAAATEARKIGEVKSKYITESVSTKFVPFVLEVTGSFGPSASGFLKTLVKAIPVPEGVSDPAPPATPGDLSHFHSHKLRRLVERITAAVHRKNSHILSTYLHKVEIAATTVQH